MSYEVYCDDSCVEAFYSKDSHKYAVIGGVWIPSDFRKDIKIHLSELKSKHQLNGEMKWNKISPASVALYKDLIEYFFSSDNVRFRSMCVKSEDIDREMLNSDNRELGFYKFYYQLIHRWLKTDNSYRIFLDYKVNGNRHRVRDLGDYLKKTSVADVVQSQALPSNESLLIQLADVLTGAVAASYNNEYKSEAKNEILNAIEIALGKPIRDLEFSDEKFNVFDSDLCKGGW